MTTSPQASAAPRADVVAIVGVSKVFDAAAGQTRALEDINLTIAPGEFVSLIGPSGCGKSTLLRLIGDLTAPSAGSVTINGKSARQARLDRDYGIVFQAPVLFDWRSVASNVALPLEIKGVSGEDRDRRVEAMLGLVELRDFAGHYPYQLSGGMQQRVSIARALALEPSILLMDEPFGALDEMTRERMNAEVQRIWQQTGTTVVFVTHSIPEAVFLSSRVRIIDVDLPRPRTDDTRETERYFGLITEVRETLRGRRPDETGRDGSVASMERTLAEGSVG